MKCLRFELWRRDHQSRFIPIDPTDHMRSWHVLPWTDERLVPTNSNIGVALLIIRYSAWSPPLTPLLELPQRKLLVYHNITPAEYLWNHSPGLAVQCAVGRIQLPAFARAAQVAVADSEFNAAELREAGAERTRVVPILVDPARYEPAGAPPAGEGPLVLSVGRLVPNKRHDLVIAAFAAYQREHRPDARLLVVGEAFTPAYGELMRRLVRESGAQGVTLTGPVPQEQVNAAYAAADVLLHLSEHEGFCIPLLEAFHFGVPVVARPAGAMRDVGDGAVLWTDPDPAVTSELLHLAVEDSELCSQMASRGRERLGAFAYETTAAAVREAVQTALAA
jgi:glycosyltransferase involved in cell wall biosynthesis